MKLCEGCGHPEHLPRACRSSCACGVEVPPLLYDVGKLPDALEVVGSSMTDEQVADALNTVIGLTPANSAASEVLEQAVRRLRRAAGGPLHVDVRKS